MHSYDEPVYLISVVATMLDIHPQTLRQYEREGLVEPSRTQGRMRLYSQRDIERMKLILRLTRQMGVNLAGVDLVLKLKEQIDEMQKEMDTLREELRKSNRNGSVHSSKALVAKSSYDIII
jgi:MerR family transcriptional regulator/heat shock protein HspR